MTGKPVSQSLKLALDLGPVAAFFVAWLLLRDQVFIVGGTTYSGFVAATATFIPLLGLSTLLLYRLTGRVSAMQMFTLFIVVVFGGMTIWLNDERFFKMKPGIVYGLLALTLGVGLIRGRSYLQLILGEVLPLQHEGWMILTRRIAIFFVLLALANEVVWRNFSTDTWVNFKTFGLTLGMFAFFAAQGRLLSRYTIKDDGDR